MKHLQISMGVNLFVLIIILIHVDTVTGSIGYSNKISKKQTKQSKKKTHLAGAIPVIPPANRTNFCNRLQSVNQQLNTNEIICR